MGIRLRRRIRRQLSDRSQNELGGQVAGRIESRVSNRAAQSSAAVGKAEEATPRQPHIAISLQERTRFQLASLPLGLTDR